MAVELEPSRSPRLIRPPDPRLPDVGTLVRIGGNYSSAMAARISLNCIFRDCHVCFDATHGQGGCWRRPYPPGLTVVTNNLDPTSSAQYHVDYTNTGLADRCFDCVLWDPTHLPYLGERAFMRALYGTASTRAELKRSIEAGAREMLRIADVGLIAKLTDAPNGSAFLLLSSWVIATLAEHGVAPCFIMHTRSRPTPRPPAEVALLPRTNGATWLAFRRDGQGRDGVARYPNFITLYERQQASHMARLKTARQCSICDNPIGDRRAGAITCSPRCRKALSIQRRRSA